MLSRCRSLLKKQQRSYYYDKDIYGFRTPRQVTETDYTIDELANRNKHPNLLRLVYAYRSHGHRMAQLDPLNMAQMDTVRELDPARYGIAATGQSYDLAGIIHVGKTSDPSIAREHAKIEIILAHLKDSYCGRIGFEFTHIPTSTERRWFATLVESFEKKRFTPDEKKVAHFM